MIDSTAAKIGRSMKKREKRMRDSGGSAPLAQRGVGCRIGCHPRQRRRDLHPRPHPLEPVDHYFVALLEAEVTTR